jgi:CHAD domain-containing protein
MNIGEYLTPRLWELAGKLRETLPRVETMADEEAVHDMRVLLRRLRSLLKPARKVYGARHTDAVRAALKAVADATGELRDEEVLEQTLGDIAAPAAARAPLRAFLRVRKKRLAALQAELVNVVEGGEAERSIRLLEALITLPIRPRRERPAEAFGRSVVVRAQRAIERGHGGAHADESTALHELRILYKRLRYAVDGFREVLPAELQGLSARAARFQKRLGEVHDLDVALMTVRAAAELHPQAQSLLLVALEQARATAVARYLEERAKAEAAPPADGPPAPAAPGPATAGHKGKSKRKSRDRSKSGRTSKAKSKGKAGREAAVVPTEKPGVSQPTPAPADTPGSQPRRKATRAPRAKPVAGQAKPVAGQAKPVAGQAKPVAGQAKPVASKARVVARQPEPAARQARPEASKARATVKQAEPVARTAEPVARTAKREAETVKPAAATARPEARPAARGRKAAAGVAPGAGPEPVATPAAARPASKVVARGAGMTTNTRRRSKKAEPAVPGLVDPS